MLSFPCSDAPVPSSRRRTSSPTAARRPRGFGGAPGLPPPRPATAAPRAARGGPGGGGARRLPPARRSRRRRARTPAWFGAGRGFRHPTELHARESPAQPRREGRDGAMGPAGRHAAGRQPPSEPPEAFGGPNARLASKTVQSGPLSVSRAMRSERRRRGAGAPVPPGGGCPLQDLGGRRGIHGPLERGGPAAAPLPAYPAERASRPRPPIRPSRIPSASPAPATKIALPAAAGRAGAGVPPPAGASAVASSCAT